MAQKLNQIIALANGKKANCKAAITEIYKTIQKPDLFTGLERKYQPLDEEGEKLPKETKIVQQTVRKNLEEAKENFVDLLDIIATQEYANCEAKADIVVDGAVLAKDVPVSYMLFLEKQVDDMKALISKLPVLTSDVKWNKSEVDADIYLTDVAVTNRTKKVQSPLIMAPATDKHPAQVTMVTEDVFVGTWNKVDLSGAIPSIKRDEMLKKVEKLREALKVAREEANSHVVNSVKIGDTITGFVFGV